MSTAYTGQSSRDERPLDEAYTDAVSNASAGPGIIQGAEMLWGELSELAHDQMQIVSLETQRVGESFVSMVVYAVAVGLLAVTAWLGLVGVIVLWLIHLGVLASVALLIAVVLNLCAIVGLIFAIRARSQDLRFSSTVESFKYLFDMVRK